MDHTLLHSPTLADLSAILINALQLDTQDIRSQLEDMQSSFVAYSLIHDFPFGNLAISVVVLYFIVFAMLEDSNSSDKLVYILQRVLRLKSGRCDALLCVKLRVVTALQKIGFAPANIDYVHECVERHIKLLYAA